MLKQKTIVLTGASGGIGSAIAHVLSESGALLILVGRNSEKLRQLNRQLGGQHSCVNADIASAEGRANLFNACYQQKQGIDILINNAGINDFAMLQQMTDERIDELVHVNLTAVMQTCGVLLPLLKSKPSAQIINIGSAFGGIGFPGFSVYCATKFGLRGFSEALHRELMDSGVTVSYFAPRATKTAINTDQVMQMNAELGTKMDKPEQVAYALVKFLHNSKKHRYFMGWPEKLFVRVNAVFPGIVDKSIFKQLPIIKRYLARA